MLTILRENATKWLTQIVLWTLVAAFVGTIFLVWGYGGEKEEKAIAKIGNHPITQAEYRRYYESMIRRVRDMAGGELSPEMIKQLGLERSALDGLVIEKLKLLAAKEAGFETSDEDLKRDIENTTEFKRNGVFDRDTYFGVLRANNLAPKEYEKILRQDIMVRKISQMVVDSVQVSEQDVKDSFARSHEQIKLRYLFVANDSVAAPRPEEKDLAAYFSGNSSRFTRPEERKLGLVIGQPMTLMPKMQISEAEVSGYYEAHKDGFFSEESVRARHVLIPIPQNASQTEVDNSRTMAEIVVKEARKGTDFGGLARKYSSDKASAKNGGDLGHFTRGQMVKEFEQAAFSLPAGAISDPVRSQFGFHVIKVEEKTPRVQKSLAEAAGQIRARLMEQNAAARIKGDLAEILNDKSGKPLADLAKARGFEFRRVSYRLGEALVSIPEPEKLIAQVVNLKKGEIAGPVELVGGIYLARVEEIIPAHTPQLAEVRKEVEAEYHKDAGKRAAEDAADKAVERLRKGEPFSFATAGLKGGMKETAFLKRGDKLEEIPQGGSILNGAFELKEGSASKFPSDKGHYIVQVAARKEADLAELDKEKDKLKETLLSRKRQDVLAAWQAGLRKEADKKEIVKIEKRFM